MLTRTSLIHLCFYFITTLVLTSAMQYCVIFCLFGNERNDTDASQTEIEVFIFSKIHILRN